MRVGKIAGIGILLLAVGLVVAKIVTRLHDPANIILDVWGLMDFWRVGYLPGEIFLEGGNPYGDDYTERNPFGYGYPLFSPLVPAFHGVLTLLPYKVAGWLAFGLNVGLLLAFSRLTLTICKLPRGVAETCLLAAFLLLSRPGYSNFMLGQFTLLCVLGTYLALHFCHTRPRLAALGLLATSIKIQFAVPVVLFLLFRRAYRALGMGVALSIAGALVPLLWTAYHAGGISPLISEFVAYYGNGQMPAIGEPGTQFMRIDLGDTLSKFLPIPYLVPITGVSLIALGALQMGWAGRRDPGKWRLDSPSGLLCLSVVLLCIYHCVYDFLLLAVPLLAVLFRTHPGWEKLGQRAGYALVVCLAIPFLNHLHYQVHLHLELGSPLWKIATSVNTMALLTASALTAMLMVGWKVAAGRSGARRLVADTPTEPQVVRVKTGP